MTTAIVAMTQAEARKAMDGIKSDLDAAMTRLEAASTSVKLFDSSEGWRLLGYHSMAGCLAAELKVTRQRAYQIMTQVEQSALLSEATGEQVVLTSRQAKALKADPQVVGSLQTMLLAAIPPARAVRHITGHLIERVPPANEQAPPANEGVPPVTHVPFHDGGEVPGGFRCPQCGYTAPVAEEWGA
jgi:hypothetical protein